MEYKVIIGRTNEYPYLGAFEGMVNKAMEDGWRPTGGIAISGGLYYQAMIKKKEEIKL